jgi:aspartate/tyrosine/aromatic aminotransferase
VLVSTFTTADPQSHFSSDSAVIMTSFFENTPYEPPNAILGLSQECTNDLFPNKINLTIGAYRTEEGQPHVLPTVREAEKAIIEANGHHEYLVQDGLQQFNMVSQELLFGRQLANVQTIQAVAGTGAVRLGADFVRKVAPTSIVAIPSTTWQNHNTIFSAVGAEVVLYHYLSSDGCTLDFEGMLADVRALPPRSVILLHACAHNPSGCDPSDDQWREILKVVQENNLLPFFDNAYQGFVSGDPEVDAFSVRLFMEANVEMIVACSFSKNFGLYGERIGALHVVCLSEIDKNKVGPVLRALSRALYSTCPTFGAKIVAMILSDPVKKQQWQQECASMASRLNSIRMDLYNALVSRNVKGTWNHVIVQRGMFSYTGIAEVDIKRLKNEHHVYMLNDGRISLAGLNQGNLGYFVDSLVAVLGVN